MQGIVRGKIKNYGFYVVVADANKVYTTRRDNYINRVVLAGSGSADNVRKTLKDSDGSLSQGPTSTARSPHLRRFPER